LASREKTSQHGARDRGGASNRIVELMLAHTQLSLLITQIRTGSVPLARCARVSCFSGSALPAPPPPPGPPLAGPPPEPNAGLIDIGANLLDTMFQGEYRGKQAHPPDLQAVLERAAASGVSHCIVTAGSLEEARAALALVRETRQSSSPVRLSCTVGVHPTRALEWLPAAARAAVEAALAAVAAAEGGPPAAAVAATAALDTAEADALASPRALTPTPTPAATLTRTLAQPKP
jgi:hypothetical protein